jgi:pyruvate formate lyase activating enzyme
VELAHLVPTSLLDYPDRVAAVLFTAGCNFRCPFCHNAELVLPEKTRELQLTGKQEVFRALEERRGFLDGVVITGGEPTLQPDLREFIREVRQLGLLVKLDTNGSRPEVLEDLLAAGLLDYVAMDVKAPLTRYSDFAGVPVDLSAIEESICLVRERAPDYEFRTTVAPGLVAEDLKEIAVLLAGSRCWFLQPFIVPEGKGLVDPAFERRPALGRFALLQVWQEASTGSIRGGVR